MKQTLKILIIDDSVDDRMLYARVLHKSEDTNYIISEVASGEEGLQEIMAELPDCVLLDYSLPGRNGLEILKRIHTNLPFLPVIMLTSHGNETIAVSAIHEGAQNYINKATISPETLQRAIKVAVEHCNLQRRIHDQRTSLEIFTRALAHDLKEPVRTIGSFLELLQEEGASFTERGKTYFNYITKAAKRMDSLIDTVYYYTRLDDPDMHIDKENCDLEKVLEEAKENLSTYISESGAEIESGNLPIVHANRTQLTQLLQNIIINAIRHSDKAPKIKVTSAKTDGQWQISISDNGPGIPVEHTEKVFEPFKRMTYSREQGLGLGLSICRKIVQSHGGRIWFESQKGDGTTFHFTVSQAMDEKTDEKIEKPINSQLGTILLVEDNEADIELTRIMLIDEPKLKCNLHVARDGREALNHLNKDGDERQPDLILLDINMPGVDGFDLLKKMQEKGNLRNIPVVMCTTSTYNKDIEKAKALGAVGYLTKPPELAKLKPVIEAATNIRLERSDGGYSLVKFG